MIDLYSLLGLFMIILCVNLLYSHPWESSIRW